MTVKLPVSRVFAIAALCAAVPSPAQPVLADANPYPLSSSADPADRLSANLMLLAQNPRDLNALIGAGQSAVAVGDGNAALSFLARAEELAPRNGRIKAALGSALVLLERPGEALKLFSEASALGIPDVDLAKDRGLAYDLTGDSRRAQRDYLIAQRFGNDDEVTRRLALSFGISGDRSNALSLLDPLLRKQDQGAWRARAFILAMTGDLEGAEGIARSVMPIGTSDTMTPFLRRLARLNPAQRALAVNFGTMPSDGTRLAMVEPADPFRSTASSGGTTLIPAGDPFGTQPVSNSAAQVVRAPVAVSRDPRRRPGQIDPAAQVSLTPPAPSPDKLPDTRLAVAPPPPVGSTRIDRRIEKRLGPVDEARLPQEVRSAMVRPAPAPSAAVQQVGVGQQAAPPPPPPPASSMIGQTAVAKLAPLPAAASEAQSTTEKPDAVFEIPDAPKPAPVPVSPADQLPIGTAMANAGSKAVVPSPLAANLSPAPQLAATDSVKQQPAPAALDGFSLAPGGMGEGAAPAPGFSSAAVDRVPASGIAMDEPKAGVERVQAMPAPAPAAARLSDSASTAKPDVGLAGIIASIEPEPESAAGPLPSAAEIRATRLAAQRKAAAEAKTKAEADAKALAAKEAKEQEKLAAARNPARLWVQVATGANESGLPLTWKRLREKSPATFKGLAAASVPFKATNRLLVGPFKSPSEARALVNAMQKAGMSATTYNSEAGQEVAKIASR